MATPLRLEVNGEPVTVTTGPNDPLLWLLRDGLGLMGTKYGCGEGECGACTVLLDGKAVRSCVTPAVTAVGKEVTTIEGLERDGRLHPVQQAFLEVEAFQCGYCTPGMILSTVALLDRQPNPSEEDIRRGLEGNLCRCGVYPLIVDAVKRAARAAAAGGGR